MQVQADGAGLRQERVCADCRGTDFVEDHAAGDIVCRGCGLVAEAHIIDERSEWRTFGDKDKESEDPSRVGAAANPLLAGGGLSTGIAKVPGASAEFDRLIRTHNRQSVGDRAMAAAMREISDHCERLRLLETIRNHALEVFKDIHEAKTLKGRSLRAVYAACVFVAAKREGQNRTLKEICGVLPDLNKVEVGRCFKAIDLMYKKQAQHKAQLAGVDLAEVKGGEQPKQATGAATTPAVIIKRFISRLGVDKQLQLMAARVCANEAELALAENVPWSARDPATVASALIYATMAINKLKHPDTRDAVPSWEALSEVTGMAPATMRDCYRSMLPFLVVPGKLVLERDATKEVLAQLDPAFAAAAPPRPDTKKRKKS